MDKDFYKKWRAKSINNSSSRRLFFEDSEISKIETDKIFSSTALEEPSESQFSLRLSESFVDETTEEDEKEKEDEKPKPGPVEVIVISDSSDDDNDSFVPPSKASDSKSPPCPPPPPPPPPPSSRFQTRRAAPRVIASSSSASSSTTSYDKKSAKTPVRRTPGADRNVCSVVRPDTGGSSARKAVVIEESDSEPEPSTMQRILKDTVAESATLSERKKKEILNWLANNFQGMRCGGGGGSAAGQSSSCSQDSIVTDSRKSATSSGNSSLERLEMNFETPNNRDKLQRRAGTGQEDKSGDNQRQSRLGQFLKKSKVGQLDVIRDRTPGSRNSDKTPTNVAKPNPRRLIRNVTPASTSSSDRTPMNNRKISRVQTPGSKNSDKTPMNNTKSLVRQAIRNKTPGSGISNDAPSSRTKLNLKKKILSDSQSSVLAENSEDMPINNNMKKNIVVPESESFESKESSDIFEKLGSKENSKEILSMFEKPKSKDNDKSPGLSETLSDLCIKDKSDAFEITDDVDPQRRSADLSIENENEIYSMPKNNKLVNPQNNKNKLVEREDLKKVPDCLEITEDIEHSDKSSEQDLNDKENEQLNQTNEHNTTNNTTINNCANILESLYGEAWRNKAKTLIAATEPRKQTKKIFREVQTDKKTNFKKPQLNLGSERKLSDKKNNYNTQKTKGSQTRSNRKEKPKDSFINDGSTTESSPDCSYYTAVSNPTPSQNNFHVGGCKTASTVKVNDKNNKNKLIAICDSESDVEEVNDNWKIRGASQRKLSFDSSGSSITSEFDPDDVVPPKTKTKAKTPKVKKSVNLEAAGPKAIQAYDLKNSFLASLSNSVPFHQADFKALTYRNKYSTLKEELCKVLYKLFNEKVFDSKLPEDLSIEWSVRLTGTAGKCYNKQSIRALGETVRSSRIVLATKVLDSPDRLRDTLIHEMCHAATWLVNNVSDGHGTFWKAWAAKAMKVFPELPPITRCHDYAIQTKYTYKCTTCGYSVGRHSKSLDLSRKRCGYCHGTFELLINKLLKNGSVQQKKSTARPREPTGFALFVKENYQSVKRGGAAMKHGEVMKLLGQQFSAVKLTPKPVDRARDNVDNDESP